MAYFLKHVDGEDCAALGYVGAPRSLRDPLKMLSRYKPGDLVLLAIATNRGPEMLRGQIFGACTLLYLSGSAVELGNPMLLEAQRGLTDRWPKGVAIRQAWIFHKPIDYRGFSDVSHDTMVARGKLVKIENPLLIAAIEGMRREEAWVYHSPAAVRNMDRRAA